MTLEFSFHVYRKVWLPHLGQHLSTKREHGNTEEECFAIAVRERSDLFVDDEDVRMSEGSLYCKGKYQLLSHLCCLHNILIRSNYTRTSRVWITLFAFYLMPTNR